MLHTWISTEQAILSAATDFRDLCCFTNPSMRLDAFLITRILFACGQIVFLTEALVLPNFYPFGTNEGDQSVPSNDDNNSGEVQLSIPFPFFDEYQKSLFVSIAQFNVSFKTVYIV